MKDDDPTRRKGLIIPPDLDERIGRDRDRKEAEFAEGIDAEPKDDDAPDESPPNEPDVQPENP